MNDEYRLTSSEYAKILGISCEALRSRRIRQIETNYIRDDYGNYWWKNDRPNGGAVNENDHPKKNVCSVILGPRSLIQGNEDAEYMNQDQKLIITTPRMVGN